ncbi:type II secretion system minor pseudopilin GspH [Shewanella yunxiaonensis]|uniref:Type II secretion system protein H n=1 Tax=Shewanella yunxiaonensis TaxID=2829809 RepID=A0ABX7YUN5_9GAMM|nr:MULTISPECIES: type II secretion system minor pseudopilin GspH [Shewanella]MDF0534573.1 type II secretion system minor pseudopilin GspH [Shewanella sp. A32]QUN06046.1 type II secretion system minor pseudopilin GspH [Shewanella yunxiaonensis]
MRRLRLQGFTLLEVMLVILLMGLMAAAVTLSIGGGDQQQQLKREAQRFISVTEAVADEAVLSGQFVGIVVDKNAYHYVIYIDDKWQPLQRDNLVSEHQLPEGISTDIEVEGLPLDQDEDKDSLFDDDKKPFDDDPKQQNNPEPQIMLLPSGEMTGFELTFIASGGEQHYQQLVSGDNLGRLVMGRFDEDR